MKANLNQDWHPAEIICELKKRGTTLSAVSRKAGLASSTLSNALHRSWPKGEILIAVELGLDPSDIWPSRRKKSRI
ncbi:helix-turn-helix transcriptional regulator [Photorhabdus heterorhabditis]|uniref:helix-turn-helix domain-containing protein n=1 Tax=Photorhabdus heterorhabditis TaxID=880156 RepID=UPI0030DCA13B